MKTIVKSGLCDLSHLENNFTDVAPNQGDKRGTPLIFVAVSKKRKEPY